MLKNKRTLRAYLGILIFITDMRLKSIPITKLPKVNIPRLLMVIEPHIDLQFNIKLTAIKNDPNLQTARKALFFILTFCSAIILSFIFIQLLATSY